MQNVCKKQETLQYELEAAEDNVAAKNIERTRAQQGKLGMMARLFGAVDTDEVRELKVNSLDAQIQEGALAVHRAKDDLEVFCDRALKDMDRFEEQKLRDLKDTLEAYVCLQYKTAKKVFLLIFSEKYQYICLFIHFRVFTHGCKYETVYKRYHNVRIRKKSSTRFYLFV